MLKLIGAIVTLLVSLDFLLDRKQIDRIRSRFIDYWIFVQELTLEKQAVDLLILFRKWLRSKFFSFLKLYFFGFILATISLAYVVANLEASDQTSSLRRAATATNFVGYIVKLNGVRTNEYWKTEGNACTRLDIQPWNGNHSSLINIEVINSFISSLSSLQIKIVILTGTVLAGFSYFIFLCLTLSFSLMTTIFLLGVAVRHSRNIVLAIIVDLCTAVALPALIVQMGLLIFSGLRNYAFPYATEMPALNHYNIGSLIIDYALNTLIIETFRSEYTYLRIVHADNFDDFLSLSSDFFSMFLISLVRFFIGIRLFLNLNFAAVSYFDGIYNWSLGLDLLYSLIYIIATFLLIVITRVEFARALVSNALKFVVENPSGPISAVAIGVGGLFAFINLLL